jgi:ribonuclease P protein component
MAPTAEPRDPAKVGLVVGRGVGGAVVRNTVARRLRHLMAQRVSTLEPGSIVVIRATPRASSASTSTLERDLDACLRTLRHHRSASSPRHL